MSTKSAKAGYFGNIKGAKKRKALAKYIRENRRAASRRGSAYLYSGVKSQADLANYWQTSRKSKAGSIRRSRNRSPESQAALSKVMGHVANWTPGESFGISHSGDRLAKSWGTRKKKYGPSGRRKGGKSKA